MDTRSIILGLVAALILAVTHALDSKLPRFASLPDGLRAVLVAVLSLAAGIVDKVAAGSSLQNAALTVLKVGAGPVVLLIVNWLAGGPVPPGGTGTIDLSKKSPASRPPTIGGPAAAMVGLSVLVVLGALVYGCAAGKAIACPVIHLADDVCPFLVELPDGGPVVQVPKSRFLALAKQEAQLQGLVDGGSK